MTACYPNCPTSLAFGSLRAFGLQGTLLADMASSSASRRGPVVTVSSNKGGVGKTTLAANLAIYTRALREDLPVLVVGLDDQGTLDRMFGLRTPRPGEANLKHAWAERNLARAVQVGQYGVHYVPSPPDVAPLKARAADPTTLARILEQTQWPGLVLFDTKSDLEALTENALVAADRVLVPIADGASLEEAGKLFALLERHGKGHAAGRVVFTLVDRRSRTDGAPLFRRLRDEVLRRGWPYYKTLLSRSPRVEALNSGGDGPLSILHHAKGTAVHAQLHELCLELLHDLGESDRLRLVRRSESDELWGSARDEGGEAGRRAHRLRLWRR